MTLSDQRRGQDSRFDRLMFQFGPSIISLYVFATLWLIFTLGDRELYYNILKWWGIMPYHYPFVDLKIILTAIDCSRYGIDVFVRNICLFGGWYSYSPVLLWTAALPISADDHLWLGIIFGTAFLLALSALPRCKSWKEVWLRSLATISTVTVFGVERTEFDLPIFMIVTVGIVLLRASRGRFAGYAVLVLAAFLKYYPAMLMILAARERFRTAICISAATIVATLAFLAATMTDTQQALGMTPVASPFADFFGARNLPLGLTLITSGPLPLTDDALHRIPLSLSGQITMGLLMLFALWTVWRHVRTDVRQLPVLADAEMTFLVAGSAVMVICFSIVQNAGPRAIFLLMTLPALFALFRGENGNSQRPLIWGILFLLWEGLFNGLASAFTERSPSYGIIQFFYWLFRELVWWWVMARLASIVIAFLWTSPALAPVMHLIGFRRRPELAG